MYAKNSPFRACVLFFAASFLAHKTRSESQYEGIQQTSERVLQDHTSLIDNQAGTYKQPTVQEYHKCHTNRDECVQGCRSTAEQAGCLAECPTCPTLITHDVALEGINDTLYSGPPLRATPGNTTNVIRLTNEIRNIIDYNAELQSEPDPKASTVGGEFGLGYDQNGSCCIVVRFARSCHQGHFSAGARCQQKRHRVCGTRCTGRVLVAKRKRTCEEVNGQEKCRERVSYVPAMSRRPRQCHHVQRWPFVECPGGQVDYARMCQRCFELPFINVVQQRVPSSCFQCYNYWPSPAFYASARPFYPLASYRGPTHYLQPPDGQHAYYDAEFPQGDGWSFDGSTAIERGDDSFSNERSFMNSGYDLYNEDDAGGVEMMRRRRHSTKDFRRSSYSLRHRN